MADLVKSVRAKARQLGVQVSAFQSNDEGEIIDFLQKEAPGSLGIVINPGALSHYSLALFDCLQAVGVPAVEVHISNIHAREEFRSKSVTGRAAKGVITGLGFAGYLLAMDYLVSHAPASPQGGEGGASPPVGKVARSAGWGRRMGRPNQQTR